MRWLILLGPLCLLHPVPAVAEGAIVQAEGQTGTLNCRGGDARVEGNRNVVTFRGPCRSVRVFGEDNRVTAEIATGAPIEVQGQRNRIAYILSEGAEPPRVSVAGLDDTVLPAAAPLRAGSEARPSQPVLPTPGTQPAARVPAAGRGAAPPAPATAGRAPVPAAGASQATPAPAAGPLVLRGDDQERAEDCAGRDAAIEGHRGNYVLRGGCRSLAIRGDLIVVQVELGPRSQVSVDGSGTVVHWMTVGRGAAPVVAIRGDGSRAVRTDRLTP